ncbi:MAG: restriction endonuclease subunit S [Deltaproteobacteria bacterium]|nr:restriction endonuclease subunit S [Deltaproteobacteria bacterium]
MNQTLEEMARNLFKSWFVDFDPVHAKAEGREPAGMDAETAALFPDGLEVSELGPIPSEWKIRSLAEVVELISGGTPKRSMAAYWGGDIPWFSVRDAPSHSEIFTIETSEKITQTGVDNSAARVLPEGTTIVTARGTVGKLALVGVPMAMNQSCYGVRSRHPGCGIFNYFRLQRAVLGLQQRTHGSVFDTITRGTFSGVKIVDPPVNIAGSFDVIVGPFLRRVKLNATENLSLEATRAILLPKLLSGQLRVSAPEDFQECQLP